MPSQDSAACSGSTVFTSLTSPYSAWDVTFVLLSRRLLLKVALLKSEVCSNMHGSHQEPSLHIWWHNCHQAESWVCAWPSISTMCFVMANDVTGCTQSLLHMALSGTCTLFDRQGFSGTGLLLAKLPGTCDEERVQQQQHECYIWVTQKRICRTWVITGAVM